MLLEEMVRKGEAVRGKW